MLVGMLGGGAFRIQSTEFRIQKLGAGGPLRERSSRLGGMGERSSPESEFRAWYYLSMLQLITCLHALRVLRKKSPKWAVWNYLFDSDLSEVTMVVSCIHFLTMCIQMCNSLVAGGTGFSENFLHAFLNVFMFQCTAILVRDSVYQVKQVVIDDKVYTEWCNSGKYNFVVVHKDVFSPDSFTEDRNVFNMVKIDDKDLTRDVNKFFLYNGKILWGQVFDYLAIDSRNQVVKLCYNNDDLDYACFTTNTLREKKFTSVLYASITTESSGGSESDEDTE